MGDDSQDQNSSAHSGKYAQYSRWPLFSYTPKHAKLNDPTRTHWLWTMRPRTCGMRAIWQRISYNVKGGGGIQGADTEYMQATASKYGEWCQMLDFKLQAWHRAPDSSACLIKKQSSVPPPKKVFPTALSLSASQTNLPYSYHVVWI